jgi:phosphatidylglycerophosphate synthase
MTEEMDDRARLSRSIYLSVTGFLAFQILLFLIFFRAYHMSGSYLRLFLSITVLFHLAVLAFLLAFRKNFALVDGGRGLARVNLANEVTLARMSTLPTLLILIVASKEYSIRAPLLVLVALVFVTDFADGWISRASRQVTFMGRMLDAISDYSVLIVLSIVFYYYELIPGWFFWIVIFRLVFQGAGMAVLLMARRPIRTQSTFMGKAAIFSTMALYTLEVLRVMVRWEAPGAWKALEYAAGGVVFFSVFEKAALLFVQLRRIPKSGARSPAGTASSKADAGEA